MCVLGLDTCAQLMARPFRNQSIDDVVRTCVGKRTIIHETHERG